MPFNVSEVGGLAVAYSAADKTQIERALKQLDPHLFLDPEVEPNGPHGPFVYMTVKHWVGSNVRPVCVLEWRDWGGPRPLTMAIVDRVKRREGAGHGAVEAAVEANRRKQQQAVEAAGEEAAERARSYARVAQDGHSAVFHRPTTPEGLASRRRAQARRDRERRLGLR